MKKIFIFVFLFFSFCSYSQLVNPVEWNFESKIIGQSFELSFEAKIKKGWNIYSNDNPIEVPVATTFSYLDYQENNHFNIYSGDYKEEGDIIVKDDPIFGQVLKYYYDKVTFKQRIDVPGTDFGLNAKFQDTLKGQISFMTCDSTSCIAEYVDFSFEVIYEEGVLKSVSYIVEENKELVAESSNQDSNEEDSSKKSIFVIFVLGFLGGLAALLTPCVFPMIPLTVSYFTKKQSKGHVDALIYGVSIVIIYVALAYGVTTIFGADALNALSTNVIFNLFFFLLFVLFAISFFGFFEITLPSSWINKSEKMSDKGGLLGIFFMAFTLSLVSFSCTGPIIGTLLVEAAVNGGVIGPIMGMLGFSLALAFPFSFFAAFPSYLNKLPKSGSWLNDVKIVLGFLELGLAIKFLSNADLVSQWGLIKRETFLITWIIISFCISIYLFKGYNFRKFNLKIIFALMFLVFGFYLIPGIKCKPLKLISGFPPPDFYSYTCKGHCPHNLTCFHDMEEAKKYAKIENKPIIIDFTGWACVNCRKMEESVWVDPVILKNLSEDYILVSLYVDQKEELPIEEQYVSKTTGKKIRTIGNKWSDYQISNFNSNTQPLYVLVDYEMNVLNKPQGYNPSIKKFQLFLQEGLDNFNNK